MKKLVILVACFLGFLGVSVTAAADEKN